MDVGMGIAKSGRVYPGFVLSTRIASAANSGVNFPSA